MLVLSRHRDESIIIGDDIIITIVDVRGDKVRLGIDAPTEIPVHRQEVYEAILRERRSQELVQQEAEVVKKKEPKQKKPSGESFGSGIVPDLGPDMGPGLSSSPAG